MEGKASRERILTSTPKDNSSLLDRHERKTLQTLQLSAAGKKLNGGKEWTGQQKETIEGNMKTPTHEESHVLKPSHSSSHVVKIYEDSSVLEGIPVAFCSRLTQTDDSLLEDLLQERQRENDVDDSGRESGYIDPEAYELMVKEDVTETYWKDLAEERRRALKESLAENECLYTRLENLAEENRKLKEENATLSDIAAKAEALRELLEGVDDDDDTGIQEGDEGHCAGLDYSDYSFVSESDSATPDNVAATSTSHGPDHCEDKADTGKKDCKDT